MAAVLWWAGPAQARQPVLHFAQRPLFTSVTLSPDGQRFAALTQQGAETRLITGQVGQRELKVALSTDSDDQRIYWVQWAGNERLVAQVGVNLHGGTVHTANLRLLSLRPDGTGQVDLARNARPSTRWRGQADQVVDWLPGDGRHLLLQLPEASSGGQAVYRVNVETGARELVKGAEGQTWRWITDAGHRVRAALAGDDEFTEVRVADADGQRWRTLWRFKSRAASEAVWPLGFGADPQQLFVEAQHQGRAAVFKVDLADPALPRSLVLAHPSYDVRGRLVRARRGGEPVGLVDTGLDEQVHWWHADWQGLTQAIDKALPGRRNRLLQTSADERRYLVHSSGQGTAGQYLIGDHDTGKLQLLAEQYPQLRGVALGQRRAVRLFARDGLALEAFLTLPPGSADRPGGPLVLYPHGGPAGQDRRGDLDLLAAMLADRGIAVLQVNFRGSSGYGEDFLRAGLQQWGQAMQDDLSDAVRWAVDQGVADAQRVCVVGGSYGGYAALMGVVKTPELFRCAASLNGVTDLVDIAERRTRGRAATEAVVEQLGHGWQDRERLRAQSPLVQAARVERPVLLVAGATDRVVPVAHSQEMHQALRAAGKPVRYLELAGADHGLSRQADRLAWFEALATFVDEHLGLPPAAKR
jgi:dipeptidyl aminopeptidase/acylaminoacyl peptidase